LEAEDLAIAVVIASDAFKQAATQHYADGRPTKADLAPKRRELDGIGRRIHALDVELKLRDLDRQRAAEEAERKAALASLAETA
jgi:hypothetical protein